MQDLILNSELSSKLLLANYEVCQSNNIEEIINTGKIILCDNDLKINKSNTNLDANFFYRKLGGVGIGRIKYGCDVTINPSVFEDFYLIQIPLSGQEEIDLDGKKIISNPEVISIINSDVKSLINHHENTDKLVVRIDRKLIEKNCQQIINKSLIKSIQFNSQMPAESQAGRQWLRTLNWINHLIADDDQLSPLILSQIENSFSNLLLNYQDSTYFSEIHKEPYSIAPAFVRRVESYIYDNAHKPITINDLAEYAGVSSRSLFNGFKKYRNNTPMRYLKDVRLEFAYEELKKSNLGEETVTNIAYKWGFNHLGYFSSDYKKRFLETPYETLSK